MSTILKVENLSHKYSTDWAIRDINFEVQEKGITGLLGANGAGKSTAMNIICGVLQQTEGEVYINGIKSSTHRLEAKKHLGYLSQNPPLYTDFTVKEYLTYTAELRAIEQRNIKNAVAEAMDKTSLAHISARLIKNLSGGYRQRVGIAQAIIHKPSIVILDEPTNGLDPNQIIEARKLIKEIAEERTVLFSSHILSEVNHLCRDIIMFEAGRIVFTDSMDAFNNYLSPQTCIIKVDQMPSEAELLKITGITKVQFLTEKECRLYFEGTTEVSKQIIAASIYQNWRLKEIFFEKSVLDDVFKQLSNQL